MIPQCQVYGYFKHRTQTKLWLFNSVTWWEQYDWLKNGVLLSKTKRVRKIRDGPDTAALTRSMETLWPTCSDILQRWTFRHAVTASGEKSHWNNLQPFGVCLFPKTLSQVSQWPPEAVKRGTSRRNVRQKIVLSWRRLGDSASFGLRLSLTYWAVPVFSAWPCIAEGKANTGSPLRKGSLSPSSFQHTPARHAWCPLFPVRGFLFTMWFTLPNSSYCLLFSGTPTLKASNTGNSQLLNDFAALVLWAHSI